VAEISEKRFENSNKKTPLLFKEGSLRRRRGGFRRGLIKTPVVIKL
jgi:hypothetical protein